jgi:hypothetical protein
MGRQMMQSALIFQVPKLGFRIGPPIRQEF